MSCQSACRIACIALATAVLFTLALCRLGHASSNQEKATARDTTTATPEEDAQPSREQGGFQSTEEPPWATPADAPRLLSEPFEHPRQLLRLLDIGESQLESFIDGQSLGDQDQEALIRVLYRLPQIDMASIHRWQTSQIPWQQLVDDPATLRAS